MNVYPIAYRAENGALKKFPAAKTDETEVWPIKKASGPEWHRVSPKWGVWLRGQEHDLFGSRTHLLAELGSISAFASVPRRKGPTELIDAVLVEMILSAQKGFESSNEYQQNLDELLVEARKRIYSVLADVARSAIFQGEKQVLLARLAEVGRASWVEDEFALRLANDFCVPIADIGEIAKAVASRLWTIAQQGPISNPWGQLSAAGRELKLLPSPLPKDDFESWPE